MSDYYWELAYKKAKEKVGAEPTDFEVQTEYGNLVSQMADDMITAMTGLTRRLHEKKRLDNESSQSTM